MAFACMFYMMIGHILRIYFFIFSILIILYCEVVIIYEAEIEQLIFWVTFNGQLSGGERIDEVNYFFSGRKAG